MVAHLKTISHIIGWIYTALWSFSNFPQIVTNVKRQSVAGFSSEFAALNTLGFTFYCIYVIFGWHFQHRWDLVKSIDIQDLLFAAVCGLSVYILFVQTFILYRRTITGSIHIIYQFVMFGLILMALYNVALGLGDKLPWFSKESDAYAYSVIQFLGFGKSFISFIKYVPQVYLNFLRKHTRGFSIGNVFMDLGGGTCSFLQMFINAYANPKEDGSPDFSYINSNIPKLILSLESVFFDLIMITQYFYYKKNTKRVAEEEEAKLRQGLLVLDPSDSEGYQQQPRNSSVNTTGFIRIM